MGTKGISADLEMEWASTPRWAGIDRPYSADDVDRLRGSLRVEHTLARQGAERLWKLLHAGPHVAALGAMTGNQAIQQVKAGLAAGMRVWGFGGGGHMDEAAGTRLLDAGAERVVPDWNAAALLFAELQAASV